MTIRRMALGVLIITVLATLVVVFLSRTKYRFYNKLMSTSERIITESNQLTPVVIIENDTNRGTIIDSSLAKIIVLSADGYPKQYQYLHNKRLMVVDHFNQGGKIIRRDLFDDKDRVRVQIFYNDQGNLLWNNFLDEKGDIIHSVANGPVFVPIADPTRVY